MPDIDQGIVTWTGGPIGTGVTVMYATPGGSFMAAIRTFYATIAGSLSNYVTLSFPSSGNTIDSATGHLTGSWSGTTLSTVTGTGGGFTSAPSGACVNWLTSTIVPGYPPSGTPHVARGRTFVVPLATNSYDSDGTIGTSAFTSIKSAADALVAAGAGHFVVWHRPVPGTSAGGAIADVIAAKVRDRAAVLTSRR